MEMAFQTVIFGSRAAPRISVVAQELSQKPFHIGIEPVSFPPSLPGEAFLSFSRYGLFGDDRRLTVSGRIAVTDARRRRVLRQGQLADLVGISRPILSNILAGRFGASPQTAERIAEMIATTPAFERQPFLPGLAA
jgi:DNA-binding XRE family transcriptional regulator